MIAKSTYNLLNEWHSLDPTIEKGGLDSPAKLPESLTLEADVFGQKVVNSDYHTVSDMYYHNDIGNGHNNSDNNDDNTHKYKW